MSKTDHLARAKDYIAKGEDYYRKAAEEILAAKREDPGLTDATVADALDRSRSWVTKLIAWVEKGSGPNTPFGGPDENEARYERHERSVPKRVAREKPELIAEAIAEAPPEAQRKIADAIAEQPTVERTVSEAVAAHSPSPRKEQDTEDRLSRATFTLWEVSQELLDEVPDAETKIRMVASAEKAQRLAAGIAHLLDTGEFEDAFRELVEEVGAEA